MSKTARVPEPSMEEILASIRRIIADDSGGPAGQTPPPTRAASPAPAPTPAAPALKPGAELEQNDIDALMAAPDAPARRENDVLELTQPVEPGPTPAFTPVRGPDVVFREEQRQRREPPPAPPVPAPAPAPLPATAPAPRRGADMTDQELLSPASTATVSAAFNSLATTILTEHARTLEDIVREMMRPMLKQWLDDNLPGLVERIVRAEIERVARGGR